MKKALATLLTILTLFVMGQIEPAHQVLKADFSLINYLETHQIDSYEEFVDVIKSVSPESIDDTDPSPEDISYFNIDIDYDNMLVSVLTMRDISDNRSQGASNNASKSYYTNAGIKIFTIYVEGTFSYTSGSCTTLSCSGNFSKPIYSFWTSTPTISSGNITVRKAYARISGTAVNGSNSTSYSLTLTCDDSGNFTSY